MVLSLQDLIRITVLDIPNKDIGIPIAATHFVTIWGKINCINILAMFMKLGDLVHSGDTPHFDIAVAATSCQEPVVGRKGDRENSALVFCLIAVAGVSVIEQL